MTMPHAHPFKPFLAALALLAACQGAGAADGAAVAVIGKQSITTEELNARTSEKLKAQDVAYQEQLRQLKFAYEVARQNYVEEELGSLVDDRVLALEATARKTSIEALQPQMKGAAVTDADARKFFDANSAQINQPFEQVAPQIKDYLQKQADESARRQLLDSLRKKHQARLTLEPLRTVVSASGPQRGPDGAPVTIVEYSDFQCPFCGKFEHAIRATLEKYPKQVRLVYRQLPLPSLHPFAQKAAEASLCAENQGKFWEMHDLLFAEQDKLGAEDLKEKAKRLGLDTASFAQCLDSGTTAARVSGDVADADQLGLSSTPATFVNGRFLKGAISVEALSAIIDDELERSRLIARR